MIVYNSTPSRCRYAAFENARHQGRIKGLASFLADGDRSEAVVFRLRDLEASAKLEQTAIAEIEVRGRKPIALPSVAQIRELVGDLETASEPSPCAHARRSCKAGRSS